MAPVLKDVTINQGLGTPSGYERLARGKETLVKLFLQEPACADADDEIEVTGGSLNIFNGNTLLGTVQAPTPAPVVEFPDVAPLATSVVNNHPGDPIFVVPGSMLQPASTTGNWTASFQATVTYRSKTSANATPNSSQTPVMTLPTAPVEKKTNALRVLVVPMGDGSTRYASQFSTGANQAVQVGMQHLARMLPVPDGVAALTATVGGLRYSIDPGMLDLGPNGLDILDSNGKFCGNSDNYPPVATGLLTFLQAWNSANPTATADRVVGAVDQSISFASRHGCGEGWAGINLHAAWVRAIHNPTLDRLMTGSLLGMETLHTLGQVPDTRAGFGTGNHSASEYADTTSPYRAYDLIARAYVAEALPVMRIVGNWDNSHTFLERADWSMTLCILGGTVTTECAANATAPASIGTATGVGAGPVFSIAGTVTAEKADITESYYTNETATSPSDPNSVYRLVQLGDNPLVPLADDGIAVRRDHTEHGTADNGGATSELGMFRAAVAFNTNAKTVELRYTGVVPHRVLYSRARNAPPVITNPGVEPAPADPENETNSPAANDDHPALSPDGELVAWTSPVGVVVAPRGDTAQAVLVPQASQPALSPDQGGTYKLAYVVNGSVFLATVTPGTPPTVDGAVEVYRSVGGLANRAQQPTVSADGDTVAFQVTVNRPTGNDDNVYAIDTNAAAALPCVLPDVALGDCPQPVAASDGVAETAPSFSSRPDEPELLAYQSCETACAVRFSDLAGAPVPADIKDAVQPGLGDGGVVYSKGNGIYGMTLGGNEIRVTDVPADAWPSLAGRVDGGTVAFSRPTGDAGQRDIWTVALTDRDVVAHITDDATAPEDIRVDVFLDCGGVKYPVAVAQVPDGNGDVRYSYDPDFSCPNGTIVLRASDGVETSSAVAGEARPKPLGGGTDEEPPVAAIANPTGTEQSRYDNLALRGSGHGAQGSTLPGSALTWEVSHAGTPVAIATGQVADLAPPANGWALGVYTVRLTASDGGSEGSDEVTFVILDDADHDGKPVLNSLGHEYTCGTGGSDRDPTDAFADFDGDGIANVEDDDPCTAATAYRAVMDFDPDTLFKGSGGETVTVYLQVRGRSLSEVPQRTVRIASLSGRPVNIAATAWNVIASSANAACKTYVAPQCVVAKFSRQELIAQLNGVVHKSVNVTVRGDAPAWSFTGSDVTNVQP